MSNPGPSSAEATRLHTLTHLITTLPSSSPSPNTPGPARKVYPNDETIVALLQSRARLEQPYTRISPSGRGYVVVNPLRVLGSLGEEARKGYAGAIEGTVGRGEERQPSVYELAGRVWLLMERRKESQSVVYQ
jgi:chitin synthase